MIACDQKPVVTATPAPTELSASEYHGLAQRGIKILMARQVVLQVLSLGASVVLARILGPADYGLYAIVSFLTGAFALFGDFGLAPSFIQRKADLTEHDLAVGFTVQLALTSAIVVVLFCLAPLLVRGYPGAPPETVWLIRALAFNLYLTAWRSISALQLERHLRYDSVARIEVVEMISYHAVSLVLACSGKGVWSLVIATISRGLVGTLLLYVAAPWTVRLRYDKVVAREVLATGLPFQLGNIISSAGGWLVPTFVAHSLGPAAVGFLSWATNNANKPLVAADSLMRVAFPHFARIQHDRAAVETTLMRYLHLVLVPAGLWAVLLVVAGREMTRVIFTTKWEPAVPALVIYGAGMVIHVMVWMTGTALNGMGMIALNTKIVAVRTTVQLLVGIQAMRMYGLVGIPFSTLVVELISWPLTLGALGRATMWSTVGGCAWVVFPICAGILAPRMLPFHVDSDLAMAALKGGAAIIAYAAVVWTMAPDPVRRMIRGAAKR